MSASPPPVDGVPARPLGPWALGVAVVGAVALVGAALLLPVPQAGPPSASTVSGGSEEPAAAAPEDPFALAREARARLDGAGIERAAAALQPLTSQGPAAQEARVALIDLLAARALEGTIRAHVLGTAEPSADAAVAVARAQALLDTYRADGGDPALARVLGAWLVLGAGGDPGAAEPLVLRTGLGLDPELRWLSLASSLWLEPGAVASDELIRGLEAAGDERSALMELALGLAHRSRGAAEAAERSAAKVLATAPDQPTALALRARAAAPATAKPPASLTSGSASEGDALALNGADDAAAAPASAGADRDVRGPGTAPARAPTDSGSARPVPAPGTTDTPRPAPPAADRPAPPGPKPAASEPSAATSSVPAPPTSKPKPPTDRPSADALRDEGCAKVASGAAAEGFATLQRAFDLAPGDTKTLLCMAEGHRALGRGASARALIDRVLRQQPRNVQALRLAAELAEGDGRAAEATELYRRLLALRPDDARARAWVDAHP